MGQDSSTIRKDIEQTRERMGDTVDALAYKSDVGARAKDAVHGRVDSVKEKLGVATDKIPDAPDMPDLHQQGRRAKGLAQDNPLGLAVGAVAVGFVAGLLIPNTRIENEHLAPVADELKEHAQEAAHIAVEQGKEAAQDVAGAAQEAAQDVAVAAQEAVGTVTDAAKDAGQEHAQQAGHDVGGTVDGARGDLAQR